MVDENTLYLEFGGVPYKCAVKAVYWNDQELSHVQRVDISFGAGGWLTVKVKMAAIDVKFGDNPPIKAFVEFVSDHENLEI